MTENEAKKHLELCKTSRMFIPNNDVLEVAIQAIEEIQQYRAIGTVEEIMDMLFSTEQEHDEVLKYRAIGTIDEFKALKEKNEPKKILYRKQSYGTPWLCPYCEADQIKVEFFSEDGSEPKEKYTFCWQCGTRIDWSE